VLNCATLARPRGQLTGAFPSRRRRLIGRVLRGPFGGLEIHQHKEGRGEHVFGD
jgi:hypothetical protein